MKTKNEKNEEKKPIKFQVKIWWVFFLKISFQI